MGPLGLDAKVMAVCRFDILSLGWADEKPGPHLRTTKRACPVRRYRPADDREARRRRFGTPASAGSKFAESMIVLVRQTSSPGTGRSTQAQDVGRLGASSASWFRGCVADCNANAKVRDGIKLAEVSFRPPLRRLYRAEPTSCSSPPLCTLDVPPNPKPNPNRRSPPVPGGPRLFRRPPPASVAESGRTPLTPATRSRPA